MESTFLLRKALCTSEALCWTTDGWGWGLEGRPHGCHKAGEMVAECMAMFASAADAVSSESSFGCSALILPGDSFFP